MAPLRHGGMGRVFTRAGFGYSGVRGLNARIATATTTGSASVVVAQRLRQGSCGSRTRSGTP